MQAGGIRNDVRVWQSLRLRLLLLLALLMALYRRIDEMAPER
jgi:hypothetical protein